LGIQFTVNLSPRPAEVYVWKNTSTYSEGSIVWYNGCYYKYNYTGSSTAGQKPNEATATYTAEDTSSTYPYATDTRTMRSWLLLDPRDTELVFIDPSYPKMPANEYRSLREVDNISAVTAAVQRGLLSLANEQPFRSDPDDPFSFTWQYYNSLPQYDITGYGFTNAMQAIDGNENFEQSWRFYGTYEGASTNYGNTNNGFSAETAELTVGGGLNSYNAARVPLGITPGAPFADNPGMFDALIAYYATSDGGPSGNGTLPSVDLSYSINLPQMLTPIELVSTAGWFGQTISYRGYAIYFDTVTVTFPPAYIGGSTYTQEHRAGGTLVYVSGDGITTPMIYEWQGPYTAAYVEFFNSGTMTIADLGDKYNEPVSAGGTRAITASGTYAYTATTRYLLTWGYVYDTLSPGLASA
jgi:hypothetical protein